jgi:hypothetical protein
MIWRRNGFAQFPPTFAGCQCELEGLTMELAWRQVTLGHYLETHWGFQIIKKNSRCWQILDPNGSELYRATGLEQAQEFFRPIPSSPGVLEKSAENEWRSSSGWILKDLNPSGTPDFTILPPLYLPQEIRQEFILFHCDSIKNAWNKVLQHLHPQLLEKHACKQCYRIALKDNICPLCLWPIREQDEYQKTLLDP